MQRVLALLDPSSGLNLVRVEGFSPTEPVSKSADLLLGADLVEYYGGDELATAKSVVISQLKYSTRHPELTWTAARLCAPSSASGASVITKLAQLYQAIIESHGRAETLLKLQLRLISNRPAASQLLEAVAAAKRAAGMPGRRDMPTLTAPLGKRLAQDIERLRVAAGLGDKGFKDFVRILDLSGCDAANRTIQEAQLAVNVRKHFPVDTESATNKLFRRVVEEGLPESDASFGLTANSVLAMFGLDSPESLLPVPVRFEAVRDPVLTQDVAELAHAVVNPAHTKLIAHGDAGVGKTTTVTQLEDALPAGSIVIPYDCFGGGSYLDPAEGRHLPGQVALQLINELAGRCGTPILIERSMVGPALWRVLRDRIADAASGMPEGDAVLVIAIDAADNSSLAAAEFGEQSFVPQIWHLSVPDNVRLIVTARTHRVPGLRAPDDVSRVVLRGFDPAASASLLRRRFPGAGDEDCHTFHDGSGGNPRVESYALGKNRQPGATLESVLRDSNRTPKETFDDLVKAGVEQAGTAGVSLELIANLVALARPASIATFANASQIGSAEAAGFCHGLVPGIRINDDTVSFRDEDFEQHLRTLVGTDGERTAHRRLGQYFLEREETEAEAAAVVAEHLFRGGERAKLVELAVTRGEPMAIPDPIVRLHSYRRRLAFGIRAALEEGAHAEAFRLNVLAGEAVRSGSAIETVVRERPDLAMRHGDPEGAAEIYMRQDNEQWRGPLHLRVAAMYAREGNGDRVREHMDRAQAWYVEARHHEESGGSDWRLSFEDLANGAEAIFWDSGGLAPALRWLDRWRPPEARFAAVVLMADALAERFPSKHLLREVGSSQLQLRVEAVFLAALWKQGVRSDAKRIQALAPKVTRALRRAPIEFDRVGYGAAGPLEEWGMHFVELSAASGVDRAIIDRLLPMVAPLSPEFAPSDWDTLLRHDLALRRFALQAVLDGREATVDDLLPERLRPPEDASPSGYDQNGSDRREFRERFGDVLPAYKIRARVIARRTRVSSIEGEVRTQLQSRLNRSEHRWAKPDLRFRTWASTTVDGLLRAHGDAESVLREIADAAESCARSGAPGIWLTMARRLARRESLQELAKELAERAADYADMNEMPASERTNLLLDACVAVDWIDPALARDYYNRAVLAAAGIDDDSIKLLELHARMMVRLAGLDGAPNSAIASRGIRLVESFRARVSDEERIPYVETLEAAAELHGPTAFAACSRWDDEGRVNLSTSVWPLVRGATHGGFLRARDGFWLLRLAGERHDIAAPATHLLEALRQQGHSARADIVRMLDDVALWIERDQPFPTRATAAREVADWAEAAGFASVSGSRRLRTLEQYAAAVGQDKTSDDEAVEWQSRAAPREPLALAGPTDLAERLDELASHYPSESELEAYVLSSGLAVGPSARVAFLEALVGLPDTHRTIRWHAGAVVSALGHLLTQWRRSARVAAWATEGIPRFVDDHFAGLVAFEENARAALEAVLRLPFVDQPVLILRGLASDMDGLMEGQLYAIASAVATSLSGKALEDAVSWSMGRLEGEDPLVPTIGLAEGPDETIADFLFAVFGNMDRSSRWRAAHAARGMLSSSSRQALADAFVRQAAKQDAGSFAREDLPFYWLSARQWLFLTLSRVADEQPALLESHLAMLIQTATSREFPHAAIREMARRAAHSIIDRQRITISAAQKLELRMANEPVSCLVERKFRYDGDGRQDREDRRFRFDPTDTLPYWFAPLGRVFDRGSDYVADLSEVWIVDRLGFTDDDWWDDQRELNHERQWREMHNDHGSVPALETFRKYLEYHAMLLTAGEIIDSGAPVAFDEWGHDPSPWGEWLSRHVGMLPGSWLADLRTPAPQEPFVFASFPPEKSWLELSAQDFDDQFLLRSSDVDGIVLYAYLTLWSRDRRAHVRIHSALVDPRTASSLLRALQTATDPHDWRLPREDDTEDWGADRFEINDRDFRLKGLLTQNRREPEGLDEHDPLARISYSFERPGIAFQAATGSRPEGSGLRLSAPDGEVLAETVLWHDGVGDETDRIVERHTEGTRTTVPMGILLVVLRRLHMDLVAEVEIEREIEDHENRGERKYEPRPTTIYVLRETGILETLERRRRLGRPDSARTRAR